MRHGGEDVGTTADRTLGIAGLGSVGRVVARRVAAELPTYTITAVAARRRERARRFVDALGVPAVVVPPDEVAQHADVVVECAPPALFRAIAEPVIARGGTLIALSAGALLDAWDLTEEAARTGATIRIPSGAMLGLDAVQAAAQGSITSVRMVTHKPATGLSEELGELAGSGHGALGDPVRVFAGTAREAVGRFPTQLNIAVALALGGIGPDRTMVEVWADPTLDRNTHRVEVVADSAILEFAVSTVHPDDAPSGSLTALSVVALLRKMSSTLPVGT